VAKAADIVGLYMSPPDNAVVSSVDEKPSIQALERAQGYLKLPNGRAMIGQSHDYKRNGTTTLFAAGRGGELGRHSGDSVVRSIGLGGYLTRFALRASGNFRPPVMRVHQGARQHGDEQAWCFRCMP
jgi:hypothetical protein